MDLTKTITLTSVGIIAFAISLTVTQLLIRKEKSKSESEGKILLAYGILFSNWVISFSFLNFKTLSILNEFVDTIYKVNTVNPLIEIAKTSVLFIGLTNTWLILWYYITKALSVIFTGKRDDVNEIEGNNYVYFILKGIVFIGFVYSLMPVFEGILRTFFPNIEIPFYRCSLYENMVSVRSVTTMKIQLKNSFFLNFPCIIYFSISDFLFFLF